MNPPPGPRLIQKQDSESSLGRGAVESAWHFMPEFALLRRGVCACAPILATVVRVTEGYRNVRPSRDRHRDSMALDFTIEVGERRATWDEYVETVSRLRILMGPEWEFEVHGEGLAMHIHAEREPRRVL